MGAKRIGATHDAADSMRSLGAFDPGAPGESEMGDATGTQASEEALEYVNHLSLTGTRFAAELNSLLRLIRTDCETAARSVAALHELDEEIAAVLRQVESGMPEKSQDDTLGRTSW